MLQTALFVTNIRVVNMDGLNSSSNPRNGRLDNGDQLRRMKLKEKGRPYYTLLWRTAQRLLRTAPPTPDEHIDAWADASTALDDKLLPLTSGYSGSEIAPTGDTKTEQRLIEPALAVTHDFLKLYAEVIKQPPPDDLQLIEQVLRHRRESLQQLHPTRFPQP
jgi:hypothetical protein